jgi:ubiquinone/menaquinone biosynthesis C-methylase UbiE
MKKFLFRRTGRGAGSSGHGTTAVGYEGGYTPNPRLLSLGTYDRSVERYVLRGGQWGYDRLKLLARIKRDDTLELFRRIEVRPGMRCLDLGCGGGEGTFELAAAVGPDGSVTGVDMDAEKLALAWEAARERGIGNVDFRTGNVNDFDEPAAYDVVYCRFLLQHRAQPAGLLGRMWAAVRPGGVIAVEDADFDGLFCDPANDGFDFYATMYRQVCRLAGGDPAIGRKLYRYFGQAGIPEPRFRLVQGLTAKQELKILAVLTLEATADAITGAGLASAAEVAAALADLRAFAAAPGTLVGDPRTFQVWAVRPS